MKNRRYDLKHRLLEKGESQRLTGEFKGRYSYTWIGADGKTNVVYSWKLNPTDRNPAGKRSKQSLRELEKEINKGLVSSKASLYDTAVAAINNVGMRKDSTIKGYKTALNFLKTNRLGKQKVDTISSSVMKEWVISLNNEGKSYSTINNYLKLIKITYAYAVENKLVVDSPVTFRLSDYVYRKNSSIKALTYNQMNSFLDFIKKDEVYNKYYNMVYILFFTGIRVSEFIGLTINNIDFDNKTIELTHQVQDGYVTSLKGKLSDTPKKRTIPMLKDVEYILKDVIDNRVVKNKETVLISKHPDIDNKSHFVFLNSRDNPYSSRSIESLFDRMCKKYNSLHPESEIIVKPHVCRHTLASVLVNKGNNIAVVSRIMGHSSYETTYKNYYDLDDTEININI